MVKKLITVAQRHNSDIEVIKHGLTDHIGQWNEEFKNLFSIDDLDWYDNFGMLRIKITSVLKSLTEDFYIVVNVSKNEVRVLAEIPETINIFSCTLEAVIKKKLKEVIEITKEKILN